MEVFLVSLFSIIIIFITVFSMVKVFNIAYQRKEITRKNFRIYVASAVVIGVCIAVILPYGYQYMFETFLEPHM